METKKIEGQCEHKWVPQITGDVENIEGCEECLETRVVIPVQHLPSDYPSDRPSVDELLAHLGTRTGLSPDFFRSSNLTEEEQMEQQADDEMKWGEEREADSF